MNGDVITLSLVFFQLEFRAAVVLVAVVGVFKAVLVAVVDATLFEHCVIPGASFSLLMKYRPLLKMP